MDATNLVTQLGNQLGISQQQAQGGLGLVLKFAKDQLGEPNFDKVAQFIPNANSLIAQAPVPSGIGGLLGGAVSSFGGKAAELGGLTTLASGFSDLGLDKSQIAPFVSSVVAFVQQKGGSQVAALLQNVLK
ncbi:MAG: DUF2780 domain-containing protein [Caldilineaceae bacterium]